MSQKIEYCVNCMEKPVKNGDLDDFCGKCRKKDDLYNQQLND